MARILISEPIADSALARLRAAHEVHHDATLVDRPQQLLEQAAQCDALIVRNRTQVRGALLEALAPRCRAVGRLGVGLDNVDMEGCAARGLPVFPAFGANAQSVAEYVLATAMLLRRGLAAYGSNADVIAGRWPRNALGRGHELAGAVLGIVGFGSIGRRTAVLAQAFGLHLLASDAQDQRGTDPETGAELLPLDELLARADIVSLHLPLTDASRHLFDAARLARMKPGAVLINTARGGIVDEAALVAALKRGALGGAAIDVFAQEPLPAAPQFDGVPNLLLTPHIAGVTQEADERVSNMVADAVLRALQSDGASSAAA